MVRHTAPQARLNSFSQQWVMAALSVGAMSVFALTPALANPNAPQGPPQGAPQAGGAPQHPDGGFRGGGPMRGGGPRRGGGGGGGMRRGMGPRDFPMGPDGMMPGRDGPDHWGAANARPALSPLSALARHHQEGIALANLAATKSNRGDLKRFAQKLITTQTNQLTQLTTLQQSTAPNAATSDKSQGGGMNGNMQGRLPQGRRAQPPNPQDPNRPGFIPGRGPQGRNMWGQEGERPLPNDGEQNERGTMQRQGQERAALLASATDFDRSFLQTMIGYQAESILTAQAALQDNANPQVTALAQQIVEQSAANIAQLSEWNRRWYKGR